MLRVLNHAEEGTGWIAQATTLAIKKRQYTAKEPRIRRSTDEAASDRGGQPAFF
jgi:hypothetical protein